MGRTRRKRSHRKSRSFRTCNNNEEIVLLNSWLARQGMKRNNKLVLAIFNDTGRGVLTKSKISAGEELITLPLNLTLNVTTILMDTTFCSIFLNSCRQCLEEFKYTVSFQSLLAFYLLYLKAQGPESKWYVYLENLPKEYAVPYFLPNEIKKYIDSEILLVVDKQKNIIDSSYKIFVEILNSTMCNDSCIQKFKELLTISEYEWSYFTVNTRCVFMDLSKVIDLNNVQNSVLNLLCDNTNISLCPYLDMINHSPNARNETKLIVSKNIENMNVLNVSADLFCDTWFSIYTKNNFEPYKQVFICYGDSHNLKLITEYGFFLPNNELDYVLLSFEDIIEYLSLKMIKLSQEQVSFINSHGLTKDLYIDCKGLSFNLYGLLMVVKYYYSKDMNVSRLLYSAAICSHDKLLNELIIPMLSDKIVKIKNSINKLETYNMNCVILDNCVALMCQYKSILEKFIKC